MGITIDLSKSEYRAGEEVAAIIRVHLENPVQARGVYASLTCMEKKKVRYTRYMPHAEIEERRKLGLYTDVPFRQEERVEEGVAFSEEKRVAGEGNYQRWEFMVKFRLPGNASPTSHEFGHDNRINVWKLHVKLDVPFALDVNADKEVLVGGL